MREIEMADCRSQYAALSGARNWDRNEQTSTILKWWFLLESGRLQNEIEPDSSLGFGRKTSELQLVPSKKMSFMEQPVGW
jgi:hypothetical protein